MTKPPTRSQVAKLLASIPAPERDLPLARCCAFLLGQPTFDGITAGFAVARVSMAIESKITEQRLRADGRIK